jgi:hypothetical protein
MRFSASNCHAFFVLFEKDRIYHECLTAVSKHLETGNGERAGFYKFSARIETGVYLFGRMFLFSYPLIISCLFFFCFFSACLQIHE